MFGRDQQDPNARQGYLRSGQTSRDRSGSVSIRALLGAALALICAAEFPADGFAQTAPTDKDRPSRRTLTLEELIKPLDVKTLPEKGVPAKPERAPAVSTAPTDRGPSPSAVSPPVDISEQDKKVSTSLVTGAAALGQWQGMAWFLLFVAVCAFLVLYSNGAKQRRAEPQSPEQDLQDLKDIRSPPERPKPTLQSPPPPPPPQPTRSQARLFSSMSKLLG